MHTNEDDGDTISIMGITREEANDIRSVLFEFEAMLAGGASLLPDPEQGRLLIRSAKFRFLLIDALK